MKEVLEVGLDPAAGYQARGKLLVRGRGRVRLTLTLTLTPTLTLTRCAASCWLGLAKQP